MRTSAIGFMLCAAALAAPADFFERRIRPVLAERCFSCHSAKAKIASAGLQLDTRAGSMRGADSGAVIVAGKPLESRLYKALLYDGAIKMPPTGRLPAEVIEDFRTWIEQGAVWPDGEPVAQVAPMAKPLPGADHWAWKPITKPSIPPVRDAAWPLDPIDQFLLAKLEAKGIHPVGDASRETWLRRITLDLTGLPPTIAEQDQFLNDRSSQAYERVADRVLASEAFGQRWGRHWLDQTYYADNIEIGRRVPARHAWRYRDYVIESINRDVPYNRFILEQLAGEQLETTSEEERRRNVIATGFLALGPWPLVNADKEQLKMDVVDLQLDMVGRTFLGITIGCARCHDHKFDPISQRDYYGMAGIFASTRTLNGRLGLSVFSNVNAITLPERPEEMVDRARETRDYMDRVAKARERVEQLKAKQKALGKDSPESKELDKEIQAATNESSLLGYLPPVPPTAHAVEDVETPADCRINLRGNAHQLGANTPRGFVEFAAKGVKVDIPDWRSGRKELAEWLGSAENPLTARVAVNRAWHHLFGAGIVPSIDNFGLRGAAPSHPELLDHLATEFIAGGWSLKKLVRRVVLTRAYRLSGAGNAKAFEADPENRLLWRMSRRRLEAETIRDSMIAVSDRLDLTHGGPALPMMVPGNMSLGKPEALKDDAKLDPATCFRRSVYLPVLRKNQLPELDVLNLFNFPDVNQITGARASTTIPTQALYLMNSPFVQQQADALAKLVSTGGGNDDDRVRQLVRRVYCRPVKPGEVERLLEYVRGFPAGKQDEAWKRLCHSLLISNEFLSRS